MAQSRLKQFASTPAGRPLLKLLQPALHFARQRAQPGVPLDEQLTEFQVGEQKVAVRHRRWNTQDALCLEQCFAEQQYDLPVGAQGEAVQRFYEATVALGRTPLILDCGANIGASVIWFALRYPKAHIVAVEPAPDNCAMLRHNSAPYSVDVISAAVGSCDGQAFLTDEFGTGMGYRITDQPTSLPMPVFSLGTLLSAYLQERYTPFLLKLDIEGAERSLFRGDTSALESFPVIVLEPHDWMIPGEQVSLPFFQFHVQAGREFAMRYENVASLDWKQLAPSIA